MPTVVASVLVLYCIYVVGRVAIVPVLASFALAYLLDPVVKWFEHRRLSRVLSSILAIVLLALIIGAVLAYVVPDLWAEGSKAGSKIVQNFTPENAARQRALLRRFSPALETMVGDKIEKFLSEPMTFINENKSAIPTGDSETESGSGAVVFAALSSSLDLLLVPFFVFYILIDFQKWRDSFEELIPERFRQPFRRLFDESGRILESFVRGQLLIGMIMAAGFALGLWLLGVPAWAGIAIMAGLLNVVPYFGTFLGFILAGSLVIAGGGGVWEVAAILGVFVAVQSLEGYILTPRILGGRLNLHPMSVFLGLFIAGKLFGIFGIVLAIPSIAIGKVFFKFLRELYQASYFYHVGDHHPSEPPSGEIEDRIADAAEAVLADQTSSNGENAGEGRDNVVYEVRSASVSIRKNMDKSIKTKAPRRRKNKVE